MANWCTNYIYLYGTRRDEVRNLFQTLEGAEQGETFDFIKDVERYFFNVDVDESSIRFETKWSPPIMEMTKVCNNYGITCEIYYEEWGVRLYGYCRIQEGKVVKINLTEEDLKGLTYDDDGEAYWHGEPLESEWELLDDLLAEKIQHHYDNAL